MPLTTAAWMRPLAAAAVSSLLYLTAGLLVARRLAGALGEPLDTAQLAIAACGFAAATLSIRLLLGGDTAGLFSIVKNTVVPANRGVRQHGYSRVLVCLLTTALPTAAALAAGLSLSLPQSTAVGLAVFWTIILGTESCFFAYSAFGRLFRIALEPQTAVERITQQLVRSQDADGAETISGILRAEFLRGQRTAAVHVAFCPPLSALPALEVSQTDGPPARVKTVQLLPYGARFDIKLAKDAAAPTAVAVQFSACVTNKSAD